MSSCSIDADIEIHLGYLGNGGPLMIMCHMLFPFSIASLFGIYGLQFYFCCLVFFCFELMVVVVIFVWFWVFLWLLGFNIKIRWFGFIFYTWSWHSYLVLQVQDSFFKSHWFCITKRKRNGRRKVKYDGGEICVWNEMEFNYKNIFILATWWKDAKVITRLITYPY